MYREQRAEEGHTKKVAVRQFFTLENPSELIELYSTKSYVNSEKTNLFTFFFFRYLGSFGVTVVFFW